MEKIFDGRNFSWMRPIRKIYTFHGKLFLRSYGKYFGGELISWLPLRSILKRTYVRGIPILDKFLEDNLALH